MFLFFFFFFFIFLLFLLLPPLPPAPGVEKFSSTIPRMLIALPYDTRSQAACDVGSEEKNIPEKEVGRRRFFPMGPSEPVPRRTQPQAIEHPVVAFKSWPIAVEETSFVSAAGADRWAIGKFEHSDQTPEDRENDPDVRLLEAREDRKKIFRSEILPQFANPERVRALANVARKQPAPTSSARIPGSPIEPRPLGFHGMSGLV